MRLVIGSLNRVFKSNALDGDQEGAPLFKKDTEKNNIVQARFRLKTAWLLRFGLLW